MPGSRLAPWQLELPPYRSTGILPVPVGRCQNARATQVGELNDPFFLEKGAEQPKGRRIPSGQRRVSHRFPLPCRATRTTAAAGNYPPLSKVRTRLLHRPIEERYVLVQNFRKKTNADLGKSENRDLVDQQDRGRECEIGRIEALLTNNQQGFNPPAATIAATLATALRPARRLRIRRLRRPRRRSSRPKPVCRRRGPTQTSCRRRRSGGCCSCPE
jgi:hypothetical protein